MRDTVRAAVAAGRAHPAAGHERVQYCTVPTVTYIIFIYMQAASLPYICYRIDIDTYIYDIIYSDTVLYCTVRSCS